MGSVNRFYDAIFFIRWQQNWHGSFPEHKPRVTARPRHFASASTRNLVDTAVDVLPLKALWLLALGVNHARFCHPIFVTRNPVDNFEV